MVRRSGIALLAAGILGVLGFTIHPYSLYPSNSVSQDVASGLWVPSHLLLYSAELLSFFGLIGLLARVIRKGGPLALAGFVLTIVGGITLAGSTLYSDVIANLFLHSQSPALVDTYTSYLTSAPIALLAATLNSLLFVGYPLFSVAVIRTKAFPGWTKWLGVLSIVSIILLLTGIGIRFVYSSGGILLGLSFMGWGYALWSTKDKSLASTS